jgi:hypothetical protein
MTNSYADVDVLEKIMSYQGKALDADYDVIPFSLYSALSQINATDLAETVLSVFIRYFDALSDSESLQTEWYSHVRTREAWLDDFDGDNNLLSRMTAKLKDAPEEVTDRIGYFTSTQTYVIRNQIRVSLLDSLLSPEATDALEDYFTEMLTAIAIAPSISDDNLTGYYWVDVSVDDWLNFVSIFDYMVETTRVLVSNV